MIIGLQQAAERAHMALKTEKKQVEGESPFVCLSLAGSICLGSAPNFCFSFMVFRPAKRSWELGDLGGVPPDGLQLLTIGVGGAAGRRPRGVPGGRGGRCAGRELDG
jgi:hypothetical protein